MSRNILFCAMCVCFFFIFLQAAEKPQVQRRVDSFAALVGIVKEKNDAREQSHVNFGLTTRKGPRIDGDPDQRKDKAKDKK